MSLYLFVSAIGMYKHAQEGQKWCKIAKINLRIHCCLGDVVNHLVNESVN
jgi:hypothetical protein